ncbi:MAG TPA: T9SS type A sorting domain-containing protein, partial [Chitinophagaceae bacterium]|nr:T9SS type A sorting domain-containing protein [Chitinophagaceae bacterium]
CFANANAGLLKYRHNIVAQPGSAPTFRVAEDANSRAVFFNAAYHNDSVNGTGNILVKPYDFTNPDYRPTANSIALSNYDFNDESLPVTLTSFTGNSAKGDNILLWQTKTEVNNSGFELQRSMNGIDYTTLTFVPSAAPNGNSTTELNYTYVDHKASASTFYYRLKQLDKDGRFMFSRVVILVKQGTLGFLQATVYPNPVANQVNLSVVSSETKPVTVVINDIYGRAMVRKVFNVSQGENKLSIDITSLAKGSYFINMISSDGKAQSSQKIIKN